MDFNLPKNSMLCKQLPRSTTSCGVVPEGFERKQTYISFRAAFRFKWAECVLKYEREDQWALNNKAYGRHAARKTKRSERK